MLNKWFIDDGVLAGPSSVVMKAWEWIEAHFPAGGMDPNPSKCQLACTSKGQEVLTVFPPSMERYPTPGNDLLGAAIGDEEHCESFMAIKVLKVKEATISLANLQNTHVAVTLLRRCSSFCKMVFFMRTSPHLIRVGH